MSGRAADLAYGVAETGERNRFVGRRANRAADGGGQGIAGLPGGVCEGQCLRIQPKPSPPRHSCAAKSSAGSTSIPSSVRPWPRLQAHQHATSDFGMVLREAAQPFQMAIGDTRAGLGLHGHEPIADDEIHLRPPGQSPVAQLGRHLPVGDEGRELVEHPVLERLAVELGPRRQYAAPRQPVDDTHVPRNRTWAHGRPRRLARLRKAGNHRPSSVSLENLEIRPRRVAGDAAIRGDVGEVDQLARRKAPPRSESRRMPAGCAPAPRPRDLLPEVVGDVGVETPARVCGVGSTIRGR